MIKTYMEKSQKNLQKFIRNYKAFRYKVARLLF